MCIAHAPAPVAPPPPPPDPVNTTVQSKGVVANPTVAAAQALAGRLGTQQLQIPFNPVSVPQ
jgi:hypothetical protein